MELKGFKSSLDLGYVHEMEYFFAIQKIPILYIKEKAKKKHTASGQITRFSRN